MKAVAPVMIVALFTATSPAGDEPRATLPQKHRALLTSHCHRCHNAKISKGKFRVDDLPIEIGTVETAERWQKVLNVLNAGEMPPEGEPALTASAKADFLDDLANVMVAARKRLSDQRGTITMRRLNRREYQNTLRELLGVEISVAELPADSGTGGFDTVGSNLFLSSDQFEQYLALGREALDEALERRSAAGEKQKLRFEAEETLSRIKTFVADNHEAGVRGQKWVDAVMAAANRRENAAIVAELRKTAKDDAALRRSWAKIPGAPSPESFGFQTKENNADKAHRAAGYAASYHRPYHDYYLSQPHLDTGAYLTVGIGNDLNSHLPLLVPFKWPIGDYVVRLRVAAVDGTPPQRRFLEFGVHPRHGQVMSTHHITGTIAEPQVIEIPLTLTRQHATRDNRTLFIREKGTSDHFTQTRAVFDKAKRVNGVGPEMALWVDWIEIERIPDPDRKIPGLDALDISLTDTVMSPATPEVRAAIGRFAREAFRGREPSPAYLDKLANYYETRRKAGEKYTLALKDTLAVVLASPMFLYLAEPVSDNDSRVLTDEELAARLSYFLWGAPPDQLLRELARRGELSKPEVLAAQTDRLLADPRVNDFTRPFLYQWLGLDRLDFFQINRTLYPRFDDSTKLAARDEVYETFAHLVTHNRSLTDLLKSDYVVVNAALADYYELPGVTGDAFRPVPLPKGSPRGGLLGMAAIHVMGGNGERTSPVERGAWVLRKLLNDPPPPPPANVPQLARLAGKLLTTRERVLAHQVDPQCASCHRKIDPIGFGLENFDAVGQWRTEDGYQLTDANGRPDPKAKKTWTIDPASKLHNGPAFRDFFELRDLIAGRSDDFARGFSTALIEYALGRPIGFSDQDLIERVTRHAAAHAHSPRSYFHALIQSREFRTK